MKSCLRSDSIFIDQCRWFLNRIFQAIRNTLGNSKIALTEKLGRSCDSGTGNAQ